jgi:hypothetical protein
MALSDAVSAVRSRAESLWPGLEPTVPLAWPNENQDGARNPFAGAQRRWDASPLGHDRTALEWRRVCLDRRTGK